MPAKKKEYIHKLKYITDDGDTIPYCYIKIKNLEDIEDISTVNCYKCKKCIEDEKLQKRKVEIFSCDTKMIRNKFKYYISGNIYSDDYKYFYDFIKYILSRDLGQNFKLRYGWSEERQAATNMANSVYNMVMDYFLEEGFEEKLTNDNIVNAIIRAGTLVLSGFDEKPNGSGYVYKKYSKKIY